MRTLTNAFATGRIAQAWMLTGVRGVGKTTTARILARALNYKTPTVDQPIDRPADDRRALPRHHGRPPCRRASRWTPPRHTGIDDIREIIERVRYAPVSARYKVYIIDEVHMLSDAGLQRPAEDAGGAAAARQVHLRHHRDPQGADHRSCRAASASTCGASTPALLVAHLDRICRPGGHRGRRRGAGHDRARGRRLGPRFACRSSTRRSPMAAARSSAEAVRAMLGLGRPRPRSSTCSSR